MFRRWQCDRRGCRWFLPTQSITAGIVVMLRGPGQSVVVEQPLCVEIRTAEGRGTQVRADTSAVMGGATVGLFRTK